MFKPVERFYYSFRLWRNLNSKIKRRNQQRRQFHQLKLIRATIRHDLLHHQIWDEIEQKTFNKAP